MRKKQIKRIKVKVIPKLDPMEVIKQGIMEVIRPDLIPAKNETANCDIAEEPPK